MDNFVEELATVPTAAYRDQAEAVLKIVRAPRTGEKRARALEGPHAAGAIATME